MAYSDLCFCLSTIIASVECVLRLEFLPQFQSWFLLFVYKLLTHCEIKGFHFVSLYVLSFWFYFLSIISANSLKWIQSCHSVQQ